MKTERAFVTPARTSEPPDWLRLDNAATIYPPTMSRTLAPMFRFSVSLKEKIDPETLETALETTLRRIPSFGYRLRSGLFWCYFQRLDGIPPVTEEVNNPLLRIDPKENRGFMFRVRYFEDRVSLEVFHALSDGTGGLTFLLTLITEYLRLKHGIVPEYFGRILDPNDPPSKEEREDAFYRFYRKVGALEHERAAYQVPGDFEPRHIIHIVTGKMNVEDVRRAAKRYNCTVTAYLASVLVDAIQTVREKTGKGKRFKREIKVSIPVNLRSFYPTRTLRNFSSYVNIGIEPKYGHYSFEEIVAAIKAGMGTLITEKRLNGKFTANVRLQKNPFIRAVPMFIKKHILSLSDRLMGDRYISTTFSNIGAVELPKEIAGYVDGMNFVLGRSRGKPGQAACISCDGTLYVSFSRQIKDSSTEMYFFRRLVEDGVPVEIESNRRS